MRHILMEFWPPYSVLYVYMISHEIHGCYSGFDGILKISSSAYPKYCQLIWYTDFICQMQLPATNTAYLVGFRGHRKLITICGKYAAVSRGIWQTGLRNLEKFATENCGPTVSIMSVTAT